ncbi:Crp/Fnr family transcriptional regulator [uncultured Cocleimonas sp.]|uniref:Crp/Fnr family transcriptional regulator n=1 Tax=uncultured Cocleimonas sp. TaxID=1051587 RepID=UPI00261E8E9E|nr:Crp/Fnr family transcriptional regulator [uncultured Cocleimonas sp.]
MARKFITQDLPKCENCAIRKSSLFGEIDTFHLDKVRELRTSQITFNAGDYIYHEGDIPTRAYTLHQGWVSLFKTLEDGGRQILRFALPGDFLSYKSSNRALDHSAIALTDITLCAFPLDRFKTKLADLPELSIAISSVSEMTIQRCYSTLTTIASHNAEVKIAYLLLSLYIRETSLKQNQSEPIHLPITQEDIGDALGLTTIHVNRTFKGLQNKGLIECNNRNLHIPDQTNLAEVAKVNLESLKKLMVVV